MVQAKAVMGGSLLCSLNFLLPSVCQFSLAEKEMAIGDRKLSVSISLSQSVSGLVRAKKMIKAYQKDELFSVEEICGISKEFFSFF